MNPHQRHRTDLRNLLGSLRRNRTLIFQLAKRMVVGRYKGSVFGLAWSFFNPLLLLAVYTIVFSVIFRSRWGGSEEESRIQFAQILFVGLIIHGMMAEFLSVSPSLITSNVNFVKKVVFPLEILPVVTAGSVLFHALVSTVVLVVSFVVTTGYLPWTVVLFPIVLLPYLVLLTGLGWLLSSLGVFIRDIGQAMGIVITLALFLAPVVYSIEMVPERLRMFVFLNPLTFIIEEARNVLIWSRLPDWRGLGLYSAAALAVSWLGFAWFQRTRKGFADVL